MNLDSVVETRAKRNGVIKEGKSMRIRTGTRRSTRTLMEVESSSIMTDMAQNFDQPH